ncbi:hypothetical protein FB451DRAFT_1213295 [Mycena latifolia]|nr:hypothetical protein FB451DRAFT_1213295 [Mycena latifolia]
MEHLRSRPWYCRPTSAQGRHTSEQRGESVVPTKSRWRTWLKMARGLLSLGSTQAVFCQQPPPTYTKIAQCAVERHPCCQFCFPSPCLINRDQRIPLEFSGCSLALACSCSANSNSNSVTPIDLGFSSAVNGLVPASQYWESSIEIIPPAETDVHEADGRNMWLIISGWSFGAG